MYIREEIALHMLKQITTCPSSAKNGTVGKCSNCIYATKAPIDFYNGALTHCARTIACYLV